MKFPVPEEFTPDCRKSLAVLYEEWDGCLKCSLGEKREDHETHMVPGRGLPTAPIMLIGDSPTEEEAVSGEIGNSEAHREVLDVVLKKLGMRELVYVTNLVLCRSFEPVTDAAGNQIYERNWATGEEYPRYKDESPPFPCQVACAQRLYEEIYIVDPLVIVAMGRAVAEFLAQKPVAVHADNEPRIIHIPGAARLAVFTEKKHEWARKRDGKITFPTVRGTVQYMMIPCNSVPFTYLHINEDNASAPMVRFGLILKMARTLVTKYRQEALGKEM